MICDFNGTEKWMISPEECNIYVRVDDILNNDGSNSYPEDYGNWDYEDDNNGHIRDTPTFMDTPINDTDYPEDYSESIA